MCGDIENNSSQTGKPCTLCPFVFVIHVDLLWFSLCLTRLVAVSFVKVDLVLSLLNMRKGLNESNSYLLLSFMFQVTSLKCMFVFGLTKNVKNYKKIHIS